MGEAGNKTKPPHALVTPHSSGRKQDVNNTEDAARTLRHPPLHSHCLRLLGKARATRVTPHDQNVDLYGNVELTTPLGPWDIIMIDLDKSLLLLHLPTLLMTFLFPVSLLISSHFPGLGPCYK